MVWVQNKKPRGVTLVEMLVTLAVLLLMMTAVVQIFQAATGALSSAQAYQELDNQLRQLDGIIRSDLTGVTCKMTPPNNPMNNPGYFEYSENEFADVQGEDSDDTLRFTAKAPAGRPFTGRMWVPPPNYVNQAQSTNQFLAGYQPITVTSDYAEIIYFLRNGNLYRRVLLVSPERQSVITPTTNNTATLAYTGAAGLATQTATFNPVGLNGDQVSWQSMNDFSAHPAPTGPDPNKLALGAHNSVVLNSLADLTNRENRWPNQRFTNDFTNLAGNAVADNVVDDFNGDNVPDYYPTLYNGILNAQDSGGNPKVLLYPPGTFTVTPVYTHMEFPFLFPGAYSRPQTTGTGATLNNQYGWIHSPEPSTVDPAGNVYQFDVDPVNYLKYLNHNPIDIGDNLPPPTSGSGYQTWWGFPTWRETLSPFWTDPTWQVNTNLSQPWGLRYGAQSGAIGNAPQFLPDMTALYRLKPQPYNDGLPANAAAPIPNGFFPFNLNNPKDTTTPPDLWLQGWEDDLIMTNVRSFDVKAYDNSLSAYADLGWGDDPRLTGTLTPQYLGIPTTGNIPPAYIPYLAGNYDPVNGYVVSPAAYINNTKYDLLNQTFAHEGRMPPRVNDNRLDAQYGLATNYLPANSPYLPTNGTYTGNIGDDQPGIPRLRRVWDSWSTEYTQAPGTGVNNTTGFPVGPSSQTPPVYPSYPPPYPAPLRGIQVQIRVTDPANQRIKTLTIRQDFTDKL